MFARNQSLIVLASEMDFVVFFTVEFLIFVVGALAFGYCLLSCTSLYDSRNYQFACYLCKEMVWAKSWDRHRAECARQNEWYIDALPESPQVTCGHCNARKLKLWPEAPDIKFACADPLCRLNNMVTIFSDGKNVYTCFRCDFTLCVGCVKAVGGEDALATVTSAASVTAAFDEATVIEIGDERLKLPPSYEDCDGVEPPTYDEWAALVVETV